MADNFSSPIDYRIGNTAPVIRNIQDATFAVEELYDFSLAVIRGLVKYAGIGEYLTTQWPLLAARPDQLVFSGNLNKIYMKCLVAITPGRYVNFLASGGIIQAQLADSTVPLPADGWSTGNYAAGDTGEFIWSVGNNTSRTVVNVLGQRYWLGVGGLIRTTPDTAAGHIEQYLGIAISTTGLLTNISAAIQH